MKRSFCLTRLQYYAIINSTAMEESSIFPIHLEQDTIMEHGGSASDCSRCLETVNDYNQLADYVERCFEATETSGEPAMALQALEILALANDPAAQTNQALTTALVELLVEQSQSAQPNSLEKSLTHILSSPDQNLTSALEGELRRRATNLSLGQLAAERLISSYARVSHELDGQPEIEIISQLYIAK